jgi:hypothetical protein
MSGRLSAVIRSGLAAALLAVGTPVAYSAALPTVLGQCAPTTIKSVGNRLEDGVTGRGVPGSGSAVSFANGGSQVSYDQVPAIDHSRPGDVVTLCLVVLPQNCPKGDDRGKIYLGINARTNESWEASDSEHSCGGA